MSVSKSGGELLPRIRDLVERCERNMYPCFTAFLTAEEQMAAKREADGHSGVFTLVYGGFSSSERNVFGFFPEDVYIRPEGEDLPDEYAGYFPVSFVHISGSSYRAFSHRDVLGSMMSLGIKREMIGDIFLVDEYTAYAAVIENVADFICQNLEYVSRDKVKVRVVKKSEVPFREQKFEDMSLTVASKRLDAVIASMINTSRDKAKKLIDEGKVSLNHETASAYDREVREGDVLSVKGYGKYKMDSLLGLTQKGRHRIVIRKYV